MARYLSVCHASFWRIRSGGPTVYQQSQAVVLVPLATHTRAGAGLRFVSPPICKRLFLLNLLLLRSRCDCAGPSVHVLPLESTFVAELALPPDPGDTGTGQKFEFEFSCRFPRARAFHLRLRCLCPPRAPAPARAPRRRSRRGGRPAPSSPATSEARSPPRPSGADDPATPSRGRAALARPPRPRQGGPRLRACRFVCRGGLRLRARPAGTRACALPLGLRLRGPVGAPS